MRNLLLLSGIAFASLTMSADKVVLVAPGAQNIYKGNAETVIVFPEGFYFNKPQANIPDEYMKKAFACDVLKIEELTDGKDYGFPKPSSSSPYSYINNGAFWWYTNNAWRFTPAKGITIKNITVRSQRFATGGTKVPSNFVHRITPKPEDSKITYNNDQLDKADEIYIDVDNINTNQPFVLQSYGQNRCIYFEIEYEGKIEQPLVPLCSAMIPYVSADEEISFDSTPGADIYYTLDGEVPTVNSTKYTTPFKLDKFTVVRAIAVKDGVESFPSYDEFFVVDSDTQMGLFDFHNTESLVTSDDKLISLDNFETIPSKTTPPTLPDYKYDLKTTELADNGVHLSFPQTTEEAAPYIARPWSWHYVTTYKPIGARTKIVAPEGTVLTNIIVVGTNMDSMNIADDEPQAGEWGLNPYNHDYGMWTYNATKPSNTLTLKGGADIGQIYAFYKKIGTGIKTIGDDKSNDTEEYYNLQGIKVAEPTNGIYIHRQGGNTKKVMVRK